MATNVTVNAGQGSTQVTVITGEGSTSYSVSAGARGPTGPTGATGAAGPNTVSTSTSTNLTGYIYGNGTTVGGATEASTGGNGAADAGKLVQFNSTGGVAVSTINNLAITAAANSTLTIDEDKGITLYDSITTEFGGYINTDAGGYIVTGVNGNITTGAGGYIQTGIGGHISTAAGGSFATGTGNLTGPNASGTVPVYTGTPATGQVLTASGTAGLTNWTSATPAGTANTLVLRDAEGGGVSFQGESGTAATIQSTSGRGAFITSQTATGAEIFSNTGTGADILSGSGTGARIESLSGTGANIIGSSGTYHAQFGNSGINQSFIARVKGALGWIRGAYTGRIHPPDTLTADRTYTLPDDTGTVALINPSTGTQTFSGSQIFDSTTRPTSSGTGTPAPTSLITRSDLETQLMSDDFVYVVDDFFGGVSVNTGAIAPGPLPWFVTTLIGTTQLRYGANTALSLPCPGGASIQTGTNNRDCGAISFASTYAGGGPITQNDFNSTTILKWRFYVQSAMGLRIGLGANPVAPTFQSTRFIGLTGWEPATVWTASTAVSVGKYYRPTTPNGRRYYASVAGTTAGTEPAWPTGAASTVTDGGVTWTEDGRDGNANFQYCTRDGTALTGTQTDSGIPYAVGWHTFTLRYLGSNNWGMSVDGASEATLNINVQTITILMQAQAYTTGQKHLLFDYFKFFQRVR